MKGLIRSLFGASLLALAIGANAQARLVPVSVEAVPLDTQIVGITATVYDNSSTFTALIHGATEVATLETTTDITVKSFQQVIQNTTGTAGQMYGVHVKLFQGVGPDGGPDPAALLGEGDSGPNFVPVTMDNAWLVTWTFQDPQIWIASAGAGPNLDTSGNFFSNYFIGQAAATAASQIANGPAAGLLDSFYAGGAWSTWDSLGLPPGTTGALWFKVDDGS